jgi:hypothetical protein
MPGLTDLCSPPPCQVVSSCRHLVVEYKGLSLLMVFDDDCGLDMMWI